MTRPDREKSPQAVAEKFERLIGFIADLKENEALDLIRELLASGAEPTRVLDVCIKGMQLVGQRFEEGRYFISALIMAGDIMRQATEMIEINFTHEQCDKPAGVILLGTVQGDIHDLGKNLFSILARCGGFAVVDLGVDVPPERFVEEARRVKPDVIGISCLLTSVLPELKATLELLRRELGEQRPKVIIGGQCIDEHIFNHLKPDLWARNAIQGLNIIKGLLE